MIAKLSPSLKSCLTPFSKKLKETTTREIGEYATAAGKAISDSWDSAKQTVTDTGGEAISDTLSAIFSGEMDKSPGYLGHRLD